MTIGRIFASMLLASVPMTGIAQTAEVTVPPAVLVGYAGTYQTEGPAVTVKLGLDGSFTIAPGMQEPRALRAKSDTEFTVEGTPMRVVFHPKDGKTDSLTIYRGERELHGTRVSK
ncbi:MAG: hypothetical protein EOP61_02565 [Sphingomonadales bacterium]|nr:MAG: hypothetical protein EOP61_02565 [Sphingomonadales bacterium]